MKKSPNTMRPKKGILNALEQKEPNLPQALGR